MGRKRTYTPLDVYMNGRRVGQFYRGPDGAFAGLGTGAVFVDHTTVSSRVTE